VLIELSENFLYYVPQVYFEYLCIFIIILLLNHGLGFLYIIYTCVHAHVCMSCMYVLLIIFAGGKVTRELSF